ncbi:MAG: hypothetical protein ACRD6W_13680, partial [Nitrososphaerales archaeon]
MIRGTPNYSLLQPDGPWSPSDVAVPMHSPDGSPSDLAPAEPMQIPAERMVGLRFLKAALARQRRVWLGAAAAGLAIGGLYHMVVPLKYWATSTVYLAYPSNTAGTVADQDALAMLQTNAVADRALAQLHEPGVTAA